MRITTRMSVEEQHISAEIDLDWTFGQMCEDAPQDLQTVLALGYAALADSKEKIDLRAFLDPSPEAVIRRSEELALRASSHEDPIDFMKTQMIFHDLLYRTLQKHGERDGMTAVFNKVAFGQYLNDLMTDSKADFEANERRRAEDQGIPRNQEKEHVAVFMIDLDGFKVTNDYVGHAAGDAVLIEVANQLKKVVRGTDIVGRLGGDEFAVAVRVKDAESAQAIQEKIEKIFLNRFIKWNIEADLTQAGKTLDEIQDKGFEVNGSTIKIPVLGSVGMVIADLDKDAKAALEAVDSQMFAEKKRRKDAGLAPSR
ncbi:MAG: diguanylate cyclase [Pseudomonadota bacterium]